MIESVQHAGSAHHSTTGDVYCMRAVPVTPRQVMFTVCGQCLSLHAEGLTTALCGCRWLTSHTGFFTPGTESQYPLNRRLVGLQFLGIELTAARSLNL